MKTVKAVHMLPYMYLLLFTLIYWRALKQLLLHVLQENTQRRLSVKSLTTETIFPTFHPISIYPFGWSAQTWVIFSVFSGILRVSGVPLKIFCIYSISMMACEAYAGTGFWSLNKLSKIKWRNLPWTHLTWASARGRSRKFRKRWPGHLPTCQLYR